MVLTLMCGLSFSGKSTLAARIAHDLPSQLISLDHINAERGLAGGQGIAVEEWSTTNRIAHDRAEEHLRRGCHVVVDDTGSPRFIRDAWRATAEAAGASCVVIWVQISKELQRERVLANRVRPVRDDVTDEVLRDHGASFDDPADEGALVVDGRGTDDPEQVDMIVRKLRVLGTR